MFVTRSAGSFVAGGTVSFMFGNAVSLVVFDSFGSGSAGNLASEVALHSVAVEGFGNFSVVVAVHLVPECLEYFAEFVFGGHHPSPPLHFYKWANLVPIHISLPSALWWHGRLPLLGVVTLSLWGVWNRCRRDWPVLPQLKRIT